MHTLTHHHHAVVQLGAAALMLTIHTKLQALVYDILHSTIAIFSYAIESRKLSANKQFFVGAQTILSLLQTTLIISNVCFMLPYCLRQLK